MVECDNTQGVKFSIGGSDVPYLEYSINAYDQTNGTSTCVKKRGLNQLFTYSGDFSDFYLVAEGLFSAGANVSFQPQFAVVSQAGNGLLVTDGSIMQVTVVP